MATEIDLRAGRSRWDDPRIAWAAFAVIAAAGFAFALWRARNNALFYDEWTWIEQRRSGLHAILSSYNQHLLAFSTAAFQLLFATVGLAHDWPYRALAGLGHVACAAAVFAYARRRIGPSALFVAAIVVFMGSGWEYIVEGINTGFTAAIACGIAALVALDRGDRRGDGIACALLVVGLVFSEFTLLFAAGIAVELTWRDGSLRRAWIWLAPLVVYGVWWLGYYNGGSSSGSPSGVPRFVADLASSAAGGIFGVSMTVGRLVLLAVVAIVAWRIGRRGALTPRLGGLLVVLAVFWLLVGFGREQLGDPWASRYIYTGVVLILLILVESFRELRIGVREVAILAALTAVAVVGNVHEVSGNERYLESGGQTVAAELGALELAHAVVPPAFILDPVYAPQIQANAYFAAVAGLGSTEALTPAALARDEERYRMAADGVLIRAGDLQVAPAAAAARPAPRSSCDHLSPNLVADTALPPGSRALITSAAPISGLAARRFADAATPIPVPAAARSVTIAPIADALRKPWQLVLDSPHPVRLCVTGGA